MTETQKEAPRLAITAAIILYFGYAIFAHWTTGIEETVKNTTMLAVGYWLGSSKGSSDKAAAMANPQPVTVTNTADNPVQTEVA